MQLRQIMPDINIRYRFYFMTAVIAVLIFFTAVNLTFYDSIPKAVICISMAAFMVLETQYLYRFNKILHNHHAALTAFILLLILIPVVDENNERGRMWIFLLPLLTFYSQNFRTSFIFLGFFAFLTVVTQVLSEFELIARQVHYTPEQSIVFVLLIIVAYIYKKILTKNENTIATTLFIDPLTDLPNRRKLIKDLDNLKDKGGVILTLINIDDFKEVNDLFGSKTGDKVIRHLGLLIKNQKCLSYENTVYRLYSDEFAVIFHCNEREKCEIFTKYITKDLSEPVSIESDEIIITVSVGVSDCARFPLEQADIALKRAKEKKEHVAFYDESFRTREKYDENRLGLLRLRRAINTDNIIPFFQPVYDLAKKQITRYESLVRLKDEEIVHSPFSFLELSKRSKLYHIITQKMIKKTFRMFADNNYSFSVNISCDDIFNAKTVQTIYSSIAEFDNPSRIMFELLETEKLEDCDEVQNFIREVKSCGCKIAVDDFGSGYSNFNYLISLNVDYIKIDSSLIKNIDTDYNSQIITGSIVNFARKMGIRTIAEYVHSKSVFDMISKLEIDYAQGYFIGKPESHLQILPALQV